MPHGLTQKISCERIIEVMGDLGKGNVDQKKVVMIKKTIKGPSLTSYSLGTAKTPEAKKALINTTEK